MMNIFQTAAHSWTYHGFTAMLETLLAEGKTTGNNQSEEYLFYAKLNLQRMHRWDKTFTLPEATRALLQSLRPQQWWVITEGWCGDSAQNLPVIAQMAEAAGAALRIVLRDDNPQIMAQYLTHGSKSIPVLAVFDEAGRQLLRWGPRPDPAQELLMAWKQSADPKPFDEFEKDMHTWYTRDKGATVQEELLRLLQN